MKALIRKIFKNASFHGFAYVARRDIHWLERTIWAMLLLYGTYCSTNICWKQWERYKSNPLVFSVERILGSRDFPYIGVTMCSNYFDEQQAEAIIRKTWQVNPEDDKYQYYVHFLEDLIALKYDNLEILEPYEKDNSLVNLDFLQIIREIRWSLFFNATSKSNPAEYTGGAIEYSESSGKHNDNVDVKFKNVITEVGMCVTTSLLHEYQNPFGFQNYSIRDTAEKRCSPFDMCSLKVVPSLNDGQKMVAYLHPNDIIVTQDSKEAIQREMAVNEITNVDVNLELSSVDNDVHYVPIKYRKCRFTDENNLKYFPIYNPILCRIECRINAALRLCKCKPFFYIVGPGPICSVKDMLCLSKNNWKSTKCECFELCANMIFSALKTVSHNYSSSRFERTLLVNLNLRKIGIRRRVVFSIDQLVVAFGGAASLFLGCSFLSFAQILYYCIQSFQETVTRLNRKRK